MITIVLLTISNIFMTFAWYGHLKYQNVPLWKVPLVSWGIAFFEYCFQVPANRIGSHSFNPAQLKTIQEVITLVVFSVFSIFYLGDDIKWNHAVRPLSFRAKPEFRSAERGERGTPRMQFVTMPLQGILSTKSITTSSRLSVKRASAFISA